MKKLLFLYAVFLLLVFPVVANATSIPVDSSYWDDSRSTTGNGITATDGWNGLDGDDADDLADNNGFKIRWVISQNPITSIYSYQYIISGAVTGDTDALSKGLSHWILEVTDGSKKKDFENVAPGFSNNSPKKWDHTKSSYPNMLSDIYGIKWETTGDYVLTYTVSFDTVKYPVWGDFYAKDGQDAKKYPNEPWATAYNLGFGKDPTDNTPDSDFIKWIATPDGANNNAGPDVVIPEPATMLLLGSGLIGIAVSGKKRFKKRKG